MRRKLTIYILNISYIITYGADKLVKILRSLKKEYVTAYQRGLKV